MVINFYASTALSAFCILTEKITVMHTPPGMANLRALFEWCGFCELCESRGFCVGRMGFHRNSAKFQNL